MCLGEMLSHQPRCKVGKPKLAKRKKDMSNESKKDHDMAQLSQNVLNTHNFEKSKRARPSVFTDLFYTIPTTDTEDAPPGTLLKLETNTDTSLYTLPPNISLSRLMYKSQTSSGSLVPVSACMYTLAVCSAVIPYHSLLGILSFA